MSGFWFFILKSWGGKGRERGYDEIEADVGGWVVAPFVVDYVKRLV